VVPKSGFPQVFIFNLYIRMHRYYVKVETSWYLGTQQYEIVNEIQNYPKIRNIQIYKLLLLLQQLVLLDR